MAFQTAGSACGVGNVERGGVPATRHNSRAFGRQLAARAWSLGLFAALRKAFLGDGS